MIDDVIKFLQFLIILGMFRHCTSIAGVSVIASKIPKVPLLDKVGASIFTCQTFVSLKILVHILCVVKGVFPKDSEPMPGRYIFS